MVVIAACTTHATLTNLTKQDVVNPTLGTITRVFTYVKLFKVKILHFVRRIHLGLIKEKLDVALKMKK
jgi:hypothetical protein